MEPNIDDNKTKLNDKYNSSDYIIIKNHLQFKGNLTLYHIFYIFISLNQTLF